MQNENNSNQRPEDAQTGNDKGDHLPGRYLPTWIPVWLFEAIGPISLFILVVAGLAGYYAYYYITKDSVRMHEWTAFMLGFIGLVVIWVQIVIYAQQAEFMKQQAQTLDAQREISDRLATTALRQFEITDRPWLKVDITVNGPLTFNARIMQLSFRFIAKNVGRSVAVNVTVNAKIIIPDFGPESTPFEQIIAEQHMVCKNVESRLVSEAVFPGDDYYFTRSFVMPMPEVEMRRIPESSCIYVYLVGCVDYQVAGHEVHHQTGFAYEVYSTRTEKPDVIVAALEIGEDVPLERLGLVKMFMGGDYAT